MVQAHESRRSLCHRPEGCQGHHAQDITPKRAIASRYFGIEPEQWLVEEGIERELGRQLADRKRPRFLFDRNFSCASFDVRFDYIIAQSIFSHASLAQIRRCLSQARVSMKATSLFAASFVEGDADYAGDAWVYPDTIRYRATTIERLAAEAGLACRRLDWFHIGGQAWFVFFVPGIEPKVDHLAALNQSFPLKEELSHYRQRSDRLERIESHLLYRLASGIRQRLKRRQSARPPGEWPPSARSCGVVAAHSTGTRRPRQLGMSGTCRQGYDLVTGGSGRLIPQRQIPRRGRSGRTTIGASARLERRMPLLQELGSVLTRSALPSARGGRVHTRAACPPPGDR